MWFMRYTTPMIVSILMPAYNTAPFIREAVQSCLDQTYPLFELIISNDGSTDHTLDILAQFNDPRVVILDNPHSGYSGAFNRALESSCGDIIARMDSDDLQDPTRIEKSVDMLLDYPDIPITTCRMVGLLENGNTFNYVNGKMDSYLYATTTDRGFPVNASIVAYKEVYDKIGGFDESLVTAGDGDWNFRTLHHYTEWSLVDEYLYIYRRHPDQLTQRVPGKGREIHNRSKEKFLRDSKSGGFTPPTLA